MFFLKIKRKEAFTCLPLLSLVLLSPVYTYTITTTAEIRKHSHTEEIQAFTKQKYFNRIKKSLQRSCFKLDVMLEDDQGCVVCEKMERRG